MRAKGYEYITDNQSNTILAVSKATGECVEAETILIPKGSWVVTPEQKEINRERKRQKQQDILESKKRGRTKEAYTFVSTTETFKGVSAANLTRLIYLSTYLSYKDSTLKMTERREIHKSELSKILGVSQRTAERFWSEVNPKYILEEDNGVLKLNADIFVRGKVKNLMSFYIKVFKKGVFALYNSVPKEKHKQLGYIFALLPYVNIEHNILCHNTKEKNIDNIQPMTMQEFCNEIGYNYQNVDRLHKAFKNLSFDVGNNRRELFCSIIKNEYTDKQLMIINPKIFYSGSNPNAVLEYGVFY